MSDHIDLATQSFLRLASLPGVCCRVLMTPNGAAWRRHTLLTKGRLYSSPCNSVQSVCVSQANLIVRSILHSFCTTSCVCGQMWTSRVEGPSNVPTAHIGRYLSILEGTSGTFQVCRHPLETHDSRHLPQHAKRQVQTCHFKRDGLVIVLGDINILKNHIWEDFPRTDNSLSKCHKCLIFNFLVTYALTNCYNI